VTVIIGIAAHEANVQVGANPVPHQVVGSAYVRAVRRAGGLPIVLPVVELDDIPTLLDRIDGLIITGGTDVDPAQYGAERLPETWAIEPQRDAADIGLCRLAIELNLPTLAICRGIQVLNVTLGGTLNQHIDLHMDNDNWRSRSHDVSVVEGSRLALAVGSTTVATNSLHHQCIDQVGERGVVVARATDGTVEAIEVDGAPAVLGVQWHPELLRHDPVHLAIFEQLVREAGFSR
jgi:putative glutamine amidotransferase